MRRSLEPPSAPEYSPGDIRAVRDRLNMSQSEFADLFDVSPRTVQAWEQGQRKAGRGVCYLLENFSRPEFIEKNRFPEPPARRPGPRTDP